MEVVRRSRCWLHLEDKEYEPIIEWVSMRARGTDDYSEHQVGCKCHSLPVMGKLVRSGSGAGEGTDQELSFAVLILRCL